MNTFFDQLQKLSPERRALLERKLAQQGLNNALPNRIQPREDNAPAPLSFAQQRLWFVQQLYPDSSAYNVASVLRLSGPLDTSAMSRALHQLVDRHETLRTCYKTQTDSERPLQYVMAAPYSSDLLPLIDLSDELNSDTAAESHIQNLINQPFDLAQVPLRCALLKLTPNNQEHLLVLATHHIVSDRWSVGVFLKELAALYQANTQSVDSPLSPLPIQYGDYAQWQREHLQGETLKKVQNYWLEQLSGNLPLLELPQDYPRPKHLSDAGAQIPVALPKGLSHKLKQLAQAEQVTLFQLLLSAFKVLLFRYSHCNDIVVGTDIANRDRPETESLIGLLVNTLVLRSQIDGNSRFIDTLQHVRQVVVDAMAHQELPFEQLVELLNPQRHLDQLMPLFQAKFDLQLARVQSIQLDGLTLKRETPEDTRTKYELRFNLQDTDAGINGQIEYSTELFAADTITAMAQHFEILLEAIVQNPESRVSDLSLLSENEKQKLLIDFNTQSTVSAKQNQNQHQTTLVHLVHQQVLKSPNAIAVKDQHQELTYSQLWNWASIYASALQQNGIQAEDRVGILVTRSVEMVVALLAALRSGACYVPLDPEYPEQRIQHIAEDAQLSCILASKLVTQNLPDSIESPTLILDLQVQHGQEQDPANNETEINIKPNQLAYIIYTSGSTGRPKGVAIEHQNTVAMLNWALDTFPAAHLSQVLAATSICFDLSVYELFLPLVSGGTAVIVDNALAVSSLPANSNITLINTVPSVLNRLLNAGPLPNSVKTVNLAGEALPATLLQKIKATSQVEQVYNLYGPSEDTTYSTWARFDLNEHLPESGVPIGQPIHNTQAYVLDTQKQPVPIGVTGELYLGGAGVARGYFQQPELTAQRFISNPFEQTQPTGPRLYQTGDKVRWLRNGQLEFLGRLDQQVKIRGYRIELDEIDHCLRRHHGVNEVVVSALEFQNDLQLVAWIEAIPESTVTTLKLRHHLAEWLPAWMVPTHFVLLNDMPRLPNGKIDRNGLPHPANSDSENSLSASGNTAYRAPRTDTERTLVGLWCELLQKDKIGIDDNFFHLGGHSLLAMDLAAKCRKQLQKELPLKALFQAPTIAGLARKLEKQDQSTYSGNQESATITLQPDPDSANAPFPLTDIQQAYLLGRNAAFELGNISTHGYREIEVSNISVQKVTSALNALIARHGMLRMIVEDGQQRVLPTVPTYDIVEHELVSQPEAHQQQQLLSIRERLSHQIMDTGQWPLFAIEASRISENRIRFHLSFDVLMGDAWSFQLLGRELALLILGHSLPPLNISFRDYVIAEHAFSSSPQYQESLEYWLNRLPDLPAAPELPLTKSLSQIKEPHFTRRSGSLSAEHWQQLQRLAGERNITPSSVVLAVFAETLSAFSRTSAFTLNLTLFNRQPVHEQVNQIVGDFTASLLLEVQHQNQNNFVHNAQRVQEQLWQDLEHRSVSAVRVQRELARQRQRSGGALMPVVFTSTLNQNMQATGPSQWQTEFVHGVSQTSQVYLDHQVSEVNGALQFNWDTIDSLFPDGFLDTVCRAHQQRLTELASNPDAWDTPWQQDRFSGWLAEFNNTQQDFGIQQHKRLQDLFFEAAQQFPNNTAIISATRRLSYDELAQDVLHYAQIIKSKNVQPNTLIAVAMNKGWQQAVATLAVMSAGAAYVPIDPNLPQARRYELIGDTEATLLLRAENDSSDWPGHVEQLIVTAPDPSVHQSIADAYANLNSPNLDSPARATDLAYVIYTSGSTGKPKGVMIDHRGAVNTILDVNQRHQVGPTDAVFGLSSLSFDLSVYDLFGTLASGATLVLPAHEKLQQPAHWLEQLKEHRVTLWNSVPALMQLLTDAAINQAPFEGLKTVLLSGDWIPLNLPDSISNTFPKANVISMGGATEASIWSIDYPIKKVDPFWHSIPYGCPLSNQQWYVLDDQMRPCPPGVTGELYIGGIGVARGYWQRPELSAERFVPNPLTAQDAGLTHHTATSINLYRTGDLGCYHANGTIEFFGREDHQVKLNGYRVELGEIEACLQQHPGVKAAAVAINGTPPGLNAYIVPQLDALNNHQKLTLKTNHGAWRAPDNNQGVIDLPKTNAPTQLLARQSHRRFLTTPINIEQLANWLSALQAWPIDGAPMPKYRYPSAGNSYPIRAYLELKEDQDDHLLAGWYYYHPGNHQLIPMSLGEAPQGKSIQADTLNFGSNQDVYDQCRFALYLAVNWASIEPMYGEGARDLALLETGYAAQLLMEQAPKENLGLCPIGGAVLPALQEQLQQSGIVLNEEDQILHGLLGGVIDPQWNEQWQTVVSPTNTSNETNADALQSWLKQQLPAYMVPGRIQPISALPLTPNGKLDRKALPEPEANNVQYRAPRSDTEQRVCTIWEELIQGESIGLDDDFFSVGGNSLIAMQMLSRLQQEFQVELELGQLYGALTPAEQARFIEQLPKQSQQPKPEIERIKRDTGPTDVDALSSSDVDSLLAQLMAESEQP